MNMKSKIESLPLYEKTYKFMLEVIGCIETFPKNSRFTLGDRIMDNSWWASSLFGASSSKLGKP